MINKFHSCRSENVKMALGYSSCNFIAILATTREIYLKFPSYLCY